MAERDSTHVRSLYDLRRAKRANMPEVEIPATGKLEIQQYGFSFEFLVSTERGDVSVSVFNRFSACCVGSEGALVDARLISPDWLPGKPGNGKLTQWVGFDGPEPVLFRQRTSGTKNSERSIRIRKNGRHFVVLVPLRPDQGDYIDELVSVQRVRDEQRIEADRLQRDHLKNYGSLAKWKDNAIATSQVFLRIIQDNFCGDFEKSAYGRRTIAANDESMARLQAAILGLETAIHGVVPIWVDGAKNSSLRSEGNVIYLQS